MNANLFSSKRPLLSKPDDDWCWMYVLSLRNPLIFCDSFHVECQQQCSCTQQQIDNEELILIVSNSFKQDWSVGYGIFVIITSHLYKFLSLKERHFHSPFLHVIPPFQLSFRISFYSCQHMHVLLVQMNFITP